ncbi:hypothetical protein ACKVMT_09845 [Halobacteriales archaeon Cl-PHB]
MGLSEIAAGVEVTIEQRDRGVAAVDDTDATLADRLAPLTDDLPCGVDAAATVVERYAAGGSLGTAASAAGLPEVTAAKTLHLLGESVSPVGPTGREVVRDWIAGELSRTEALELARVGETAFALAVFVETHEPLPEGRAAIEAALSGAALDDDPLADAVGDVTDHI